MAGSFKLNGKTHITLTGLTLLAVLGGYGTLAVFYSNANETIKDVKKLKPKVIIIASIANAAKETSDKNNEKIINITIHQGKMDERNRQRHLQIMLILQNLDKNLEAIRRGP